MPEDPRPTPEAIQAIRLLLERLRHPEASICEGYGVSTLEDLSDAAAAEVEGTLRHLWYLHQVAAGAEEPDPLDHDFT
jgi:hypothetical protein